MGGKVIEVPGQGLIEFPEDMPDQDIVAAIRKNSMAPKTEPAKAGYSAKDLLGGQDAMLSMGTGMAAGPLSGLAGIAGAVLPGPKGQGADWVRKTGNALTYQPKTLSGQQAVEAASLPGQAVAGLGNFVGERVSDAGSPFLGAWLNGGINAAPMALGLAPKRSIANMTPEHQLLRSEGVNMTPGQLLGGSIKRFEDAATSFPVLGDSIQAAKRAGIESFNDAALNRALSPIGEKLPTSIPPGNKGISHVQSTLGEAYDSLLPNLRGELNPTFRAEINNIRSMGANLPKEQRGQLNRIIDNEIMSRFTPQGLASGEVVGNIKSKLNDLSSTFKRSDNYDVRTLGNAVEEMNNSLKRMLNDVNPQYAGELKKIDEGYRNFKVVQNAASNVGAHEGVFSPAQLHRAVRAADRSKDKGGFAKGTATMQDLSTAGKELLPSGVPDSGTPYRAALMYALAHPGKSALMAAPMTLGAIPYLPGIRSGIQGILTHQFEPAGLGLLSGGAGSNPLFQQ